MNHLTPLNFLKEETGAPPSGSDGKTSFSDEATTGHGGRVLVCKACQTVITRPDLAQRIHGEHHHVFFNPHGYVFEIGCFASAKHIIPTGPKSDEFTWFPGYFWQAVACTGCSTLLGWRYTGDSGGFYGLILSALTEKEGRKA